MLFKEGHQIAVHVAVECLERADTELRERMVRVHCLLLNGKASPPIGLVLHLVFRMDRILLSLDVSRIHERCDKKLTKSV